jgi:hypothetical protein
MLPLASERERADRRPARPRRAVAPSRRRAVAPSRRRAIARTRRGIPAEQARAEARLGLAVVRGLLLDLLATGDRAGVDAAMERYLAIAETSRKRAL